MLCSGAPEWFKQGSCFKSHFESPTFVRLRMRALDMFSFGIRTTSDRVSCSGFDPPHVSPDLLLNACSVGLLTPDLLLNVSCMMLPTPDLLLSRGGGNPCLTPDLLHSDRARPPSHSGSFTLRQGQPRPHSGSSMGPLECSRSITPDQHLDPFWAHFLHPFLYSCSIFFGPFWRFSGGLQQR